MRILLAEPSKIGRSIIVQMLEADGHVVASCATAEQALSMLEGDETIDVLITAIEFLEMSGLELCWSARILAGSQRPLHIVVMSASTDEMKLAEALDTGADDFIGKPPKKTELLARLRSAQRMIDAQKQLIRVASFDSLTNLRNRRVFFEALEEEEKSSSVSSVLVLDVDYFKQVNDRYGHDGGDLVLKEVANRLRKVDPKFARIGGEEFALLVKGPIEQAAVIAETVRREIAVLPIKLPTCEMSTSISVGVAQRMPGTPMNDVMKDADVALYAAKSGGRNRVTLARFSSGTANFSSPEQKTDAA
ncbi:MAG: diguanylate cyclase [Rhizobiales bacterium]|nr:diguanylate cyclase [Hyphomicrobiales bacterium]